MGSNLVELLKDDFRIIGTYHHTPVTIPGITCLPCDVLIRDYVSNIVARFRPDITIYAAGITSLNECHLNPKLADALNSVGAINCCIASERYGSKFVFISSGFVLGGENTLYREGEIPFPNTVYGNSLSSAEFYVQRSCLNYLILRCSPLYGRGYHPGRNNWFERLQIAFAKGEPALCDDSIHTGFVDIHIMVKLLKALLMKDVTNRLLHFSSRDSMTRYEFARLYAKIFKKDEGLIQKMTAKFPVDKNRNREESSTLYYHLDTSNIEEFLNTQMPRVEDSLQFTFKRFSGSTLA